MRVLCVVAMLFLGCPPVQGPAGEPGAPGAKGEPGDRGPAGPALTWFDSTGLRVGVDPVILSQGVRWPLNLESAEVELTTHTRAYESADCTGPVLVVNPPLPRLAFMVVGDPSPHVRGDGAQSVVSPIGSVKNEAGVCSQATGSQRVVRLDTVMPLTLPQSVYAGPLHVEVR